MKNHLLKQVHYLHYLQTNQVFQQLSRKMKMMMKTYQLFQFFNIFLYPHQKDQLVHHRYQVVEQVHQETEYDEKNTVLLVEHKQLV
jgi:hypothetical protein